MIAGALAALGRRGAEGFALSILLGLAMPQFAAEARPLLPLTIFGFMTVVFLRADFSVIGGLIRRPVRLLAAMGWQLLAPVVLVLLTIRLIGSSTIDPGLLLGLAVLGAAPPIMSSPAVAILYGFEPSLVIASVLGLTLLSPLTAPLLVDVLAGQAVPLDQAVLMQRLLIFVGGGIAAAMVLRRWLGTDRVRSLKAELDGFGVVMYFVFAVAAMDGVTAAAMSRPGLVAGFVGLAFGLALAGLSLAILALRGLDEPDRFMVGYGTAQRNMGLLIAALGAGVPSTTFLFFALAQFPIYLMPWILKPVAARIANRRAVGDGG
ncbi:MAG TPA: hypothetical protein PLQ11_11680 [Beijerinckiaceae bacterium]|nr:hypothetical protein [Beijerinckiaceae bacterium]